MWRIRRASKSWRMETGKAHLFDGQWIVLLTRNSRLLWSDLLTLLLQRNKNLRTIPEFFKSMSSLRVLDLHGTSIESLPSSLSSLICLRGLYLNSCIHLVELPTEIEALVQLEVLDIRGTKISLLQIRSLVWLKCLRYHYLILAWEAILKTNWEMCRGLFHWKSSILSLIHL